MWVNVIIESFWKIMYSVVLLVVAFKLYSWFRNPIELMAFEKAGDRVNRVFKSIGKIHLDTKADKKHIAFKNGMVVKPLPFDKSFLPHGKENVAKDSEEWKLFMNEYKQSWKDKLDFMPATGLGGILGRKTLMCIYNNGELTPADVRLTNNPHDHVDVLSSLQYLDQKKQAFVQEIKLMGERYTPKSVLQKYAVPMMFMTVVIIGVVFLSIVVMEFIQSGGGGGGGGSITGGIANALG